MALRPGSRLGPYEVTALIGTGGMGEVYRALDITLGRQIAIKVLPDAFASDPERLARFEREAKTLAALNHASIAQIFGFVHTEGIRALVMELVEGETLADRLVRGPIPLDDALRIARQIADALEAAHEQGIIHRDLKPANVKLRPDGAVKVLDFGLAKALATDVVEPNVTNSPTLSLGATRAGVILGTAAYMSPEQANGYPSDRRADVWSFGAVLFEMLAGRRAFPGESVSDTLATVLKVDPDWEALPTETPASVRKLLRRCLTRDRRLRLQAIGEARIAMEMPDEPPSVGRASSESRRSLWMSVAAGVFAVAFAAISLVHFLEKPPASAPVQRFEISMPDPGLTTAVVSPDGARLVFYDGRPRMNERGGLVVRALDSLESRPLPNTEGVIGLPFWSPDSRYVAFTSTDRKLRKIDVVAGTTQVICDAISAVGGFWTSEDTIVFSNGGRLVQVPAGGGTASPLPGFSERDTNDRAPMLLPDGRHFAFFRLSRDAGTYLGSRDGADKPRKLLDGVASAFAPSNDDANVGYLLFLRAATPTGGPGFPLVGTLMAQRFDLRELETVGEPVLISDRVGPVSVSRTGVLAFVRAGVTGDQLTIFDRQGKALQTVGEPDQYSRVSFSPDGSRFIAARGAGRVEDYQLWMFDLTRGLASRFPTDRSGGASFPVWSPDGTRIVFASNRSGKLNLYQRLSNGGGEDELLFKSDEDVTPLSWSADGRFLGVGATAQERTHFGIRLDSKGQPASKAIVFVRRGLGIGIEFSPGPEGSPRWIAYQSTRDSSTEVYLREFDPDSPTLTPAHAGEWQVSKGGGTSPRWNPNGRELFYLAPDRTVMAVDLTGNANTPTGLPKPLFKAAGIERALQAGVASFSWAVSPDGKRFLFSIPADAGTSTPPLTVVLNWTSLLAQ